LFTGIVETMGAVVALEPAGDLVRIAIEAGAVAEGVCIGDSIAVNGGCLTVTEIDGERLAFEAIRETQERTALADLAAGSKVNLERAMRADGRLDGHIVQGHVDGVGTVRALERLGDDVRLAVECGQELADAMVEKGSVTIDGVSLTVAGVSDTGFEVALIPHTLQVTTLGERQPGDRVNLEADVLGKYVKRYVERILSGSRDHTPR
jgi:riboflavin synthase